MSAAEKQSLTQEAANGRLIYIVDDEVMVGDVVQIILRMGGFQPRFFQDPELALKALVEEDCKPALLLTDYRMTPINGMELIERSKGHCPQMKTILYSGNAGEEIFRDYSVRPDSFLRKPFLPRTLLASVWATLRGECV